MAPIDRRTLLLGLGSGLLAGCETVPGIADRGKPPAEGGIGGTGIVGVLTGFSSLLVNGLRIGLPDDAEIVDVFGRVGPDALAVGQSLTIEAATDGLTARRVVIDHPLIGPIEAIDISRRRLRVLGTEVSVPDELVPALVGLRPGMSVKVSGLWRAGTVVASRIAPRGPGAAAMAGAVRAADGALRLGGMALDFAAIAPRPDPGDFITVVGTVQDNRFVVETLRAGRFVGAAGPLEQLVVEGYLETVPLAPGYAVEGLGHSFDPEAQLAALAGRRSLFAGPYTGDFAVSYGAPLPEETADRMRRLAAIADGAGRIPTR